MLNEHLIAKTRPLAATENIVLWKKYRVTVLQDRLFRVEHSENGRFRDAATQSVWFRDMPPQNFTVSESDVRLVVSTDACKLILRENREECLIKLDGKLRKICNYGNYKGTYRTLDNCDGEDHAIFGQEIKVEKVPIGNGVCSATGVAVFDDADSLTLAENGEVLPEKGDGTDEYVFAYGKEYRNAVKALYLITGEVPMVPRFALGNWWSRYWAYNEREYLALLNRFEEYEVPLTIATIDMDWHYSEYVDEEMGITEKGRNTDFYGGNIGWTGYTWNKKLFPDYRSFLRKVAAKNLKITLNLHPADGIRWWEECYEDMAKAMGRDSSTGERIPFDIADPRFIDNYFSVIHKPYENDGVSFWWIDWQQGTDSGIQGLDPLWALNHYHYLDHAENHAVPLILSRYAGIGSHRYPLGFSGDTCISWKTLRYLPYFTLTASNVGYTWWSHDIGGHHFGTMDTELYVRHVQFGVFSPINRLHCTSSPIMTKEPWKYGNGTGEIAKNWLRLRHRLIPFLYSCDYRTHKEGLALIEPLYYIWADAAEAIEGKNEYLFGGQLLVAPVTDKMRSDGYARVKMWIPEGIWTDIFTGDVYEAAESGETKTLLRDLESIPVLAKAGAVLPLSADRGNAAGNPERLEVWCYSGEGSFTLYEDGTEDGRQGEFFTAFESENSVCEGTGVQSLRISSAGEKTVLPENRLLIVRFKNLDEGKVVLYIDGIETETEDTIADCVTVKIPFEAGKEYRIEVKYPLKSRTESLIARAKDILIASEGDNENKKRAWYEIQNAKNVREYAKAVDDSAVEKVAKLRLKETL